MDELRGFNEEKLWRKMFMDDDEFENWLKDLGLLHQRRYCCDKEMNLCSPRRGENWGRWKCSRCKKEKGYLTGTFFAGTHQIEMGPICCVVLHLFHYYSLSPINFLILVKLTISW